MLQRGTNCTQLPSTSFVSPRIEVNDEELFLLSLFGSSKTDGFFFHLFLLGVHFTTVESRLAFLGGVSGAAGFSYVRTAPLPCVKS